MEIFVLRMCVLVQILGKIKLGVEQEKKKKETNLEQKYIAGNTLKKKGMGKNGPVNLLDYEGTWTGVMRKLLSSMLLHFF